MTNNASSAVPVVGGYGGGQQGYANGGGFGGGEIGRGRA